MALESGTYINDLVITNPGGNDGKDEGDDHLRLVKACLKNTLPGLAGAFARVQSKTGSYTVVANDNSTLIRATGALTLNLTAAATLGNKHFFSAYAHAGDITIDPNASETVNDATTLVVPLGYLAIVWCDGASFYAGVFSAVPPVVGTITGNTTLTATTFSGTKEITNTADVTLPAASALQIGARCVLHSSTTKKVRIVPAGSNTLEGINAAYRLPSYEAIEVMCISSSAFILLRAPRYAVGQLVPSAVAQTLPGFVAADFSAVSRTTYEGLYDLIGTTHGPGDGASTFNVPDTRGLVLKGAGTGSIAENVDFSAVNTGADTITVVANADTYMTGTALVFTSAAPPSPLVDSTTYYAIRISNTTIKLATSLANAQAGTAINLTTQGSGTHTLTHNLPNTRSPGDRGGDETHLQVLAESALHNHGGSTGNSAQSYLIASGSSVGSSTGSQISAGGVHAHSIPSAGGSTPMDINTPYGVAQFYVKT